MSAEEAVRATQGILALIFNHLTIVGVFKYPFLRTPPNILIASLALSDLLHGLIDTLLLPLREHLTAPTVKIQLCRCAVTLETICILCQYAMFTSFSIERFSTIRKEGKRWTRKKALVVVIVCWCVILTQSLLVLPFSYDPHEDTGCNPGTFYPKMFLVIGILYFFAAFLTIIYFYGRITHEIMKRRNQVMHGDIPNTAQIKRRAGSVRAAAMMAIVVGVFFCLYFPAGILSVTLKPDSPLIHRVLSSIMLHALDVNFWINPIIYVWQDKLFKKAFGLMFGCCRCRCRRHLIVVRPQVDAFTLNNWPALNPHVASVGQQAVFLPHGQRIRWQHKLHRNNAK